MSEPITTLREHDIEPTLQLLLLICKKKAPL